MTHNIVEINLAYLAENYNVIQRQVGPAVRVLSIVKSDAYGHGLVEVSQAISKVGGNFFGVAEVEEGVSLREAKIFGDIVVLLGSSDYAEIVEFDLNPVVFELNNIRALSKVAADKNRQIGVHLKIDIGMGRVGIMPQDTVSFLNLIDSLPGVFLAGTMGHLPLVGDCTTAQTTAVQCRQFIDLTVGRENRHIANSAAIISCPEAILDIVRPGISLYGCYPMNSLECRHQLPLKPVMSFKSRIIQIKEVPSGYGVSYGHLFVTKRPTKLAVLPVGYADGYLRRLTGLAQVLVRGCRVPVCGRICMNACLLDVTDLEDVRVGDEVVLMGSQGDSVNDGSELSVSADEIAGWLDTINYEVLCHFGCNNKRKYL